MFQKLHKDTKPADSGYLPGDGVRIWVSEHDLSPDDTFLEGPGIDELLAQMPVED